LFPIASLGGVRVIQRDVPEENPYSQPSQDTENEITEDAAIEKPIRQAKNIAICFNWTRTKAVCETVPPDDIEDKEGQHY